MFPMRVVMRMGVLFIGGSGNACKDSRGFRSCVVLLWRCLTGLSLVNNLH